MFTISNKFPSYVLDEQFLQYCCTGKILVFSTRRIKSTEQMRYKPFDVNVYAFDFQNDKSCYDKRNGRGPTALARTDHHNGIDIGLCVLVLL